MVFIIIILLMVMLMCLFVQTKRMVCIGTLLVGVFGGHVRSRLVTCLIMLYQVVNIRVLVGGILHKFVIRVNQVENTIQARYGLIPAAPCLLLISSNLHIILRPNIEERKE